MNSENVCFIINNMKNNIRYSKLLLGRNSITKI